MSSETTDSSRCRFLRTADCEINRLPRPHFQLFASDAIVPRPLKSLCIDFDA